MVNSPHYSQNHRAGFGRRFTGFEVRCLELAFTLVHYLFRRKSFTRFPLQVCCNVPHGVGFYRCFLVAFGAYLDSVDVDYLVTMVPSESPGSRFASSFFLLTCTFSCVFFQWLLFPIGLNLKLSWTELVTVLSGPCLVWLMFCWHKSNVLSHFCLENLISLSCPVYGRLELFPGRNILMTKSCLCIV